MICPICGAATALYFADEKGRVCTHKDKTNSVFTDAIYSIVQTTYHDGNDTYGVCECLSCGKYFVVENEHGYVTSATWKPVYPIYRKPVPEGVPSIIKAELEEANLCLGVGAYLASIAVFGLALEHIWNEQGVKGLDGLFTKGIISGRIVEQSKEIRLWNNSVKHDMSEIAVTQNDAEELSGYVEALVYETYVAPMRLAELKKKRELREKTSS